MKKDNKLTYDPAEIKSLLVLAHKTQAAIGRRLGVTRVFVNNVITGRRHTKRVRKAIARAVGKRINELWPSRPFKKAA